VAFAVRSRVLLGLRCVVARRTAGPFSFSDWSHLLVIPLIYGRRGRCLKAEDAQTSSVVEFSLKAATGELRGGKSKEPCAQPAYFLSVSQSVITTVLPTEHMVHMLTSFSSTKFE